MLLLDREGQVTAYEASMVESGSGNISGRVTVPNPKLWWPYLMDPEPGYLYTVKVRSIQLTLCVNDTHSGCE